LGVFGSTVARELERLGNEVLGIDKDEGRVNDIADDLTHSAIADAHHERVLRELGVADYDAVIVAIGESLEANLLCTIAVKALGVQSIWVKSISPEHHRLLELLGADRIINPEQQVGLHVARTLIYPNVLDYIALGDDEYVVELSVPTALAGRRARDLHLTERYGIQVLAHKTGPAVTPGASATAAAGANAWDLQLAAQDRLLLLGRLTALRRFAKEEF
jgi:trk system potassium uptake protein TrkA